MKKKALGKGLDALIPGDVISREAPETGLVNLRISEVKRSPFQPRTAFDEERLSELSRSIAQQGLIQPIVVRSAEDGYEVVAGERRLRAAEMAGLRVIPGMVIEANDEDVVQIGLIENIQRDDLNPIDRAAALNRLMEEFSLTQQEVATRIGKDRASVANYVRVLSLPNEVKDLIRDEKLSFGHARALLSLDNPAQQRALAREVMAKGLSVRQCERAAARKKAPPPPRAAGLRQATDQQTKAVEEQMQKLLGTKVRIVRGRKTGRIEIEFYSDSDLNRILDLLNLDIVS